MSLEETSRVVTARKIHPKSSPTPVIVGQLWQDCDKRENGRTVRVERIEGNYAYCRIGLTERTTRIRLDRFRPTSTGFKLLRDENGQRVTEMFG